MRKGFAVAGLICGILGVLAGFSEWFLYRFVLDMVEWDGPLLDLYDLSWLSNAILLPAGIICLAIACLVKSPAEETLEDLQSPPPPPMPPAYGNLPRLPPPLPLAHQERSWPRRRHESPAPQPVPAPLPPMDAEPEQASIPEEIPESPEKPVESGPKELPDTPGPESVPENAETEKSPDVK